MTPIPHPRFRHGWWLAAVVGAACDPAPAGPGVDARLADAAAAVDAIDGPPADAPVAPALPPLLLDPSFDDDGGYQFGPGYAGRVTTSGDRIELCGTATHEAGAVIYTDAGFSFRTTPGASESVLALWPYPAPTTVVANCSASALDPDGTSVTLFHALSWPTRTYMLARRELDGTYHGATPSPATTAVVDLHALGNHQTAMVATDAVWLLDPQLAPVASFGAGGRLPLDGEARWSTRPHTAAPRIDVVTTTSLVRIDPATGARDPAFGVGGAVALPPIVTYGVAPLPGGGELIVGEGLGLEVSVTGAVTSVALPARRPSAVVEDRAGGAYLVWTRDEYPVEFTVTRVAPVAPGVWGDGGSQPVVPPELCPIQTATDCWDWLQVVDARWSATGKLAISLQRHTHFVWEQGRGHNAQLVVLTR